MNLLLGLQSEVFKQLAGELDAIIHNGAEVNLVKPYHALKSVNVLGTQEVLRLAVTNGLCSTRVKPVHFISTNGVIAEGTSIEEDQKVDDWSKLTDGYARSKWVAEQLCLEARARGLPVAIYRPGNMAPSSQSGRWNSLDFIYLLVRGCQQLKYYPVLHDTSLKFDMTPVDFAARAIVYLVALRPVQSLGRILHVQNPEEAVLGNDFFKVVFILFYSINKIKN